MLYHIFNKIQICGNPIIGILSVQVNKTELSHNSLQNERKEYSTLKKCGGQISNLQIAQKSFNKGLRSGSSPD